MQLFDAVTKSLPGRAAALDHEQILGRYLDCALPGKNRPDARDDINAGGKPLLDERAGYFVGGGTGTGDKD